MQYQNLGQMHRRQAERFGARPALRYKRHGLFHDFSWERYHAEVLAAAAALVDAGVKPGDRVGMQAENCLDWLVADMAILTAGGVTVSPHAPLTARQVHYQFHHAEVCWAIVSNREQLAKVQQFRHELPALRGIVAFDPAAATGEVVSWAGFRQRGRHALSRLGAELARREETVGHDDLAAVMYTSGTTGNPKGVMLTHGNIVSNCLASLGVQTRTVDDIVLSWLPYTHIYARTVDHYAGIAAGVTLALADSVDTLVENLAEIQPTHFCAVPRFYEKVLAAVTTPDPQETGKRLKRIFGARMQWMSAGGAPLPLPVAQAYQAAGLKLLQGYGLTESSPVISFNTANENKLGTVGRPLPGIEVRIAPDGEVLTRGPHVMKGYWKEPESTRETIRDGWLHTGDLGSIDADGFLSITGRKKELMVLSNGKKVVPTHLEGLLVTDPCIDQAIVVGEGRNFLTALLVPNWATLKKAMGPAGASLDGQVETLAENPAVRDFLERRVKAALADLSPMEQVRKFVILTRPFSVENDEITVSLKLRRNVVLQHYAKHIDGLYRAELAGAGVQEVAF
jgi:long-chain acyl-CoA synthetase